MFFDSVKAGLCRAIVPNFRRTKLSLSVVSRRSVMLSIMAGAVHNHIDDWWPSTCHKGNESSASFFALSWEVVVIQRLVRSYCNR
jgi:hypothetical protein